MAHYAFIDENNIVKEVIVGNDESNIQDLPEDFTSWEEFYQDFKGLTCKRTSFNTKHNTHSADKNAFRGNYAGIGYTYDSINDVFISPKPHESWTLNTNTWSWEAPIDYPTDDNIYIWDESVYRIVTGKQIRH